MRGQKKETSSITGVVSTGILVRGSGRIPFGAASQPFLAGKLGHMACGGRAVCGGDGRMQRIGRAKKLKDASERKAADSAFPFFHCFTVSGCAPLSADGSRNLLSLCPACQYGLHLADARSQLAALFHQQLFARGNGLVSLSEQAHIFNQRLHGKSCVARI